MNDDMHMSPRGLDLTKTSEGLLLRAYPDPKTGAKPWTIGYGHTKDVREGDICTIEQAMQWLLEDYGWVEQVIRADVTAPLTQGQYDALGDFIFNEGPGEPRVKDGFDWLRSGRHSSLLLMVNAGNPLASEQFLQWDVGSLPGLMIRHRRQKQLFDTGNWV
jgi:lysozyme